MSNRLRVSRPEHDHDIECHLLLVGRGDLLESVLAIKR